ncbi:hypothetical protein L1987_21927 [Smallanthus sonchifolius]|uniref:Uncharacterized protein n=1 Tax=Smallanthus sonchifolius TaxID=185202 RepID=A0ACB9IG37_9ASTR|nr:hypothetical protein L1987_21927 [Smallanthus sonchifolius]
MKEGSSRLAMTSASTLVATMLVATMSSSIAMALVDERMSTEGTGLPFGLSNNLLGWINLDPLFCLPTTYKMGRTQCSVERGTIESSS